MHEPKCPSEIDLSDEWDFAYSPLPVSDKTAVATHTCFDMTFDTRMPVPGYWDDHLGRLDGTSGLAHALRNRFAS